MMTTAETNAILATDKQELVNIDRMFAELLAALSDSRAYKAFGSQLNVRLGAQLKAMHDIVDALAMPANQGIPALFEALEKWRQVRGRITSRLGAVQA
jgi:hypothetical protein